MMTQRPIKISSDVKRGDTTVFVIVVGDVDESRTARYFEVRLADGSHSMRAEWSPSSLAREAGFDFRLIVDGGTPTDLILRDGSVFEPGYAESAVLRSGSFLDDSSLRTAVLPFWIFDESDVERARLIAPRFTMTTESDALTDWAGCEADFTGAGAGIGAVAGAIAGAAKGPEGALVGAGAGAVIGGVAGAAFGLGYCTAQAVCG